MKAVYAGTFDPFTKGHHRILFEASYLFSEVHLVFANNPNKKRRYDVDKIMFAVDKELKKDHIPNYKICKTDKLIVDYARENGIQYSVRGLRNHTDFNYEENIAKINNEIYPVLKTIYFRTDNEMISSSTVNLLFDNDKSILKYVSDSVFNLMEIEREITK